MNALWRISRSAPDIPNTDAFRDARARRPARRNAGRPHRAQNSAAPASGAPQCWHVGPPAMSRWTSREPISRLWSGPLWPASLPAEQLHGEREDGEREDREDAQVDGDLAESGAVDHDLPDRVGEVRERHRVRKILDRLGEAVDRDEHPAEEEHRQRDDAREVLRAVRALRDGGDEEPEGDEHDGAESCGDQEDPEVPDDLHAERQDRDGQEDRGLDETDEQRGHDPPREDERGAGGGRGAALYEDLKR